MIIGVITKGKHGLRLIETIRSKTDMSVVSASLPCLPEFIEDPSSFLEELDEAVFDVDLLITYSLHPDLTPEIIRLAEKHGVQAIIVPGGYAKAGSRRKLVSKKYNIHVRVEEVCCAIEPGGNNIVSEFASKLGRPMYRITTSDGIITKVDVIRGTPCGGSWFVAEELVGTPASEAPTKAGLLIQYYPCWGKIHVAAEIQKKAVIDALETSS
ncbi:MAG: DUF166 domain-containing protein [Euryarchaeota archaeon]|nr:DUF166 domain-containing protein [Euryarchaeota archaeon]